MLASRQDPFWLLPTDSAHAQGALMPAGKSFPTVDTTSDWYKDAIIYQTHVRAFKDASEDGYGDFPGLTSRLDYLQDLGVTAIWLMPFYPSPLRDDGYDISDYRNVHPSYGTLSDFHRFMLGAHRRGLRVITELVLNHTSDQHPWFQRARNSPPGSRWRSFYVWSDTPDRYNDVRIIFEDFESSNWTWDPVARQYYWHRFYSHQPDLNFENPEVHRAMLRIIDFWFRKGVDGLRLDAVPYLYQQEGTSCENLKQTHEFLRSLRHYIDEHYPNRMLLAEANQWPEDAISYFGAGDECHMAFHFPLMPRLFMAVQQGDRFPVIDILQETPEIPENCQWAIFLRNHDELTLEMVTDEERDYMYRAYAHDKQARVNLGIRRRLAPLLGNDRRKLELMNGLLFSLPGTPIIYYGDEIGMGDNIYLGDRDAVRTPMQWSSERNAGFSATNPQRLYLPTIVDPEYHYEAVNIEAQQVNPNSLLWWMKRLLALRKRHPALNRGRLEFLHPQNHKVLAFLREHEDQRILVVANLSGQASYVELDLSAYRGMTPLELFGQVSFPPIGDLPYLLTLGPYAFYWMSLETPKMEFGVTGISEFPPGKSVGMGARGLPRTDKVPRITANGSWDNVIYGQDREKLESVLPVYLTKQRWFRGKARSTQAAEIKQITPVPLPHKAEDSTKQEAIVATVQVSYKEGEPDTYVVPLLHVTDKSIDQLLHEHPYAIVAELVDGDKESVLCDAFVDERFAHTLFDIVARRRKCKGQSTEITGVRGHRRQLPSNNAPLPKARVSEAEQSNTSVIYDDKLILKLFRAIEPGLNPDLEIGRFLTDRARFRHTPPVAGWVEYRVDGQEPGTLAILQELVPNEGDAWRYTLDDLSQYYNKVLSTSLPDKDTILPHAHIVNMVDQKIPESIATTIGSYLSQADLIGKRTAELHNALSSDPSTPSFAPETLTALHRRSIYQQMGSHARKTLQLLRQSLAQLPDIAREQAIELLDRKNELMRCFERVHDRPITATRIRCHGDYHLGQLLYTGRDFVILDFEGEPTRPLSQRRLKRPPLWDVAGMLRSFDYAATAALLELEARGIAETGSLTFQQLEHAGAIWQWWVSITFLRAYLNTAKGSPHLPDTTDAIRVLLDAYLLEKAIFEVGYELDTRPEWVHIPLKGIVRLLDTIS